MNLAAGIGHQVRNAVVRFIIKLFFVNNSAPYQFSCIIKGKDSNIVRMPANVLEAVITVSPIPAVI